MTTPKTVPLATRLATLIREGGRTYSGPGQYAALVAMYPFITYFSLFDFVQQVPQPQVFDIGPAATGGAASNGEAAAPTAYQVNAIAAFFVTGYVPAVLHCLWRKAWGWLLIGMAAAHFVMLDLTADFGFVDFGAARELIANLPMIGVKISFLWIVFRGRIYSTSFLLYCFTSALLTSVLAQTSGYETIDAMRQVLPLIVFAMTVALVRLVIFAIVQNSYFIKQLGWRRCGNTLAHTAVLWIPILVFAVPYFAITAMVQRTVEDAAYEQRAMLIHPHDEEATVGCAYLAGSPAYQRELRAKARSVGGRDRRPTDPTPAEIAALFKTEQSRPRRIAELREAGTELRRNTMYSIYRFYACKQQEWIDRTTEFERRVRNMPYDQLSDEFKKQYNEVLTSRLPMKPPNYSGFMSGIKNWSVEEMQDQINGAYSFIRNSARDRLARKIDDHIEPQIETASGRVGDGVVKLRDEITPLFQDANRATQISVWWVFSTLHALHMFAHILFIVLCIKSFMYVFGRVAFASDAGAFLTLGDPQRREEMPHGPVRITGQNYSLGEGTEGTYYFSRRFQPHGMPPRFTIPQPSGAPIARLLHRSMTMNRFDLVPQGKAPRPQVLYFTVTGSKTFVEWTLEEGETIVFDFTNFVGMAGSVKLSTLISARISTLQLGRYVFSTATGPGRIVLLTGGTPKTGDDPETEVSMPPERLIAWQRDVRFHVDSSLALPDIYLSTAYVRKEGPGNLVMDVDRQTGKGTGLSRFITHFLWPG
ncbi:hypothetical protein [Hwanghaeella sp.]|uniref:hypothetical protein n=1 Tax=Hwanghaeella sp. TaxID=2605943 RepID=UPI003CCB9A70